MCCLYTTIRHLVKLSSKLINIPNDVDCCYGINDVDCFNGINDVDWCNGINDVDWCNGINDIDCCYGINDKCQFQLISLFKS